MVPLGGRPVRFLGPGPFNRPPTRMGRCNEPFSVGIWAFVSAMVGKLSGCCSVDARMGANEVASVVALASLRRFAGCLTGVSIGRTSPVAEAGPWGRFGCRLQVDSYLVDPARSHMLVSKIKPCMCKYKRLNSETANGSLNQL